MYHICSMRRHVILLNLALHDIHWHLPFMYDGDRPHFGDVDIEAVLLFLFVCSYFVSSSLMFLP